MFKKALIVGFLVFSVFLTGCGKTEKTKEPVEIQEEQEQKQINKEAEEISQEDMNTKEEKSQEPKWSLSKGKYTDKEFNLSAEIPNGWYAHESLDEGPNKGRWYRRIKFSNYNKEKENEITISNVPKDYLSFEIIIEDVKECKEAEQGGYKNTSDIKAWRESFKNLKKNEAGGFYGQKMLVKEDICLSVSFSFPENTGEGVTEDQKKKVVTDFVDSVTFN